jgi:hypothetical protein
LHLNAAFTYAFRLNKVALEGIGCDWNALLCFGVRVVWVGFGLEWIGLDWVGFELGLDWVSVGEWIDLVSVWNGLWAGLLGLLGV